MTEQHECELEIVRRAVPYAVCTNPSCPLAIYEDEINKRLNEYEKLNTQRNELIAAVAGMRDKWTPPDEVAKLQTENEKLKKATEALTAEYCREVAEMTQLLSDAAGTNMNVSATDPLLVYADILDTLAR